MSTARIALAALALVACKGGGASETDANSGSSTGIATSGSSSTAESTGGTGSSSGGDDGDPSYPKPDPVLPEGTCPAGWFGPITFDGFLWICLPECTGEPPSCPTPTSGTAAAECATNPFSSNDPCDVSADCTVDGELCGNVGGGMKGCLLPPSHCILQCDDAMICPDEMVCGDAGVCGYPP